MIDLPLIEATARAATPGPWRSDGCDVVNLTDGGKGYPLDTYEDSKDVIIGRCPDCGSGDVGASALNMAHIALCSPSTVLALVERVRELEARIALLEEALRQSCNCDDIAVTPPTDWGSKAPIPHHCDCPLFAFDLPDPVMAPTAHAEAVARIAELRALANEKA